MVTFDKTDVCLLIVIVASISYLYLSEDERLYVRPDAGEVSEDFDAETTRGSLVESARDCKRGATVTNRLIVDLSDSNVDKLTAEDILNAFFTVSL